jgi:hypothetical protein
VTDQELIHRFETDTLAGEFHHADHVRLAFAYLSQYPVLQALEKFATALKRFAAARNKSQLYHETITYAYFFLIRERMARTTSDDWNEFADRKLRPANLETWNPHPLLSRDHSAIRPGPRRLPLP